MKQKCEKKQQLSGDNLRKTYTRRPGCGYESLNRETDSVLIAAKNNSNYIKVKINNTQRKSNRSLFSDKDESINQILSKLAQKKYKTKHDWWSAWNCARN